MTPQTEAEIKRHSVLLARKLGYVVVLTSQPRRNASKGIPDAFVGHSKEGNVWIAVDFKGPKGKPTKEQQSLIDMEMLTIIDSVDKMEQLLAILGTR